MFGSILRIAIVLCFISLFQISQSLAKPEATSLQNFSNKSTALSATVENRVNDLLSKMSLEEKVQMVYGDKTGMGTLANTRLGIPSLKMADGPLGVRIDRSTAFPAGVATASSFNPALMQKLAEAMAEETLAHGKDVLLGPCVNISRAPQGGRNFESFGEDPYLTSAFAAAWVNGVQSKGVVASTKHLAVNDQEFERMTINVNVDERTLHEIHLPAFVSALRAGTWTVMSSYNRINGFYASANNYLQNEILKKLWGFPGFVVSDWGAVHDVVGPANAGLDLEMPSGEFWGQGNLLAAVQKGDVSESTIDDKVRRLLRVMIGSGSFDRQESDRPSKSVINSKEHQKLALVSARQGAVLLKNNNSVLPLISNNTTVKKIAVIGPNSLEGRNNGGGSSRVVPFYNVGPLEGLKNRAGDQFVFTHTNGLRAPEEVSPVESRFFTPEKNDDDRQDQEHGLKAEYFANTDLAGEPAVTRLDPTVDFDWISGSPDAALPVDGYSVRWSGYYKAQHSGKHEWSVRSDDGVRLWVDGELLIDDWIPHAPATQRAEKSLEQGQSYHIRLEYFEASGGAQVRFGISRDPKSQGQQELEKAIQLAKDSDLTLVFAGSSEAVEGEGVDRPSLNLPPGQDQLIHEVARVNPNTVVVLNGGGAHLMPWANEVAGIVQAWYLGQEGGNAIADLLLGKENFSGKLPVSFYANESDVSSYGNYPGENGQVHYREGIFVGYRHLDKEGIAPLFPFGHGLSYTRFQLGELQVVESNSNAGNANIQVRLQVKNIGDRSGAEVVQLYVHDENPSVPRPPQELKAFQRIELSPGESGWVTFSLNAESFAYYDEQSHAWRVSPGKFELRVGTSSRDLPLHQTISLKGQSALLPAPIWGKAQRQK